MVYVINQTGQPLMPTCRYGKVKRLLKAGQAKVVRQTPFTIQLRYPTNAYKGKITIKAKRGMAFRDAAFMGVSLLKFDE